MAAATGTSSFVNPETGDTYYLPTDWGGGGGGFGGGFGGSGFGGDSGGFSGFAEGKTSNYQDAETPFNPEIGKIGPNFLEKAYNYVTDNPRKVLSTIGNFTVGPLITSLANAGYDLSQGADPIEAAKNFAIDTVTGKASQFLGQEAANLGPLVQGAVQGSIGYGLPSLLRTGDVDFGKLGIAAATGGIGREFGSEFGPLAGAAASSATSGLLRGQDPTDVLGNAALAAARTEFNRETFPGAAQIAGDVWGYFNPSEPNFRLSDYLPSSTDLQTAFAGLQPWERDSLAMNVGPRDPVGYVPDPSLVADYAPSGGGTATAPTPAAPPAPAPATTTAAASAPQVDPSIIPFLLSMGLLDSGGGQQVVQAAPQMMSAPTDLSWLSLNSYLNKNQPQQKQTLAGLLQSLGVA